MPLEYLYSPSEQFKKIWAFIRNRSDFITPEVIAKGVAVDHDTAEEYLNLLEKAGVLKRPVRYPAYVFYLPDDWDLTEIPKRLTWLKQY